MSGVDIIIANKNDSASKKGLASLAHSLLSLNKYAVVRYVWRSKSAPKLCVLAP